MDEGSNMVRLFSQIENFQEHSLTPIENTTDDESSDEDSVDEENSVDENKSSASDSDEEDNLEIVDEEIGKDLSSLQYLEFPDNIEDGGEAMVNELDYNQEYDTARGERIEKLDIQLGTDILPRISCAAHKTNICVRTAIKSHLSLSNMLRRLSKFCASSRRSIFKANLHNDNKSRLRCDNQTRGNSSFLMLVSVKKAYKKKTFNDDYQCPYSLPCINNYIQVLLPVYRFSLFMQRNNCPIGEVIPALLMLFEDLKKLKVNGIAVTGNYAALRDLLTESLQKKFYYELHSNVYLVSSLLMTSKLHMWYKRSFGKEFARQAISALVEVVMLFKPLRVQPSETDPETTPQSAVSGSLLQQYSQIPTESEDESANKFSFNYSSLILNEKTTFIKLLDEKDLTKIKSTKSFWLANVKLFPNLSKVAVILTNITSNSAFVERFFSLCGIISNQKTGNMSDDLLIIRSML